MKKGMVGKKKKVWGLGKRVKENEKKYGRRTKKMREQEKSMAEKG